MRTNLCWLPLSVVVLSNTALADPPSRSDYAAKCAAQMGTIPEFDCMKGKLLEIEVNGHNQSHIVQKCDKPVGLGLSVDGQCVPFSRLLMIDTGNPDVTTVAICRKYHMHGNDGAQNSTFDDIAMIQHDKKSGRTCFYQSDLEADLEGKTVPSPMADSAAAKKYWLPSTADLSVSGINCPQCHTADPFIWSPYVAQVADLARWDPNGKYDSNFANMFGRTTTTFKPLNGCTACHRFGTQGSSSFGCNFLVPRYAGNPNLGYGFPPANHPGKLEMPPSYGGSSSTWHATYDDAVDEVMSCCDDPNGDGCRPHKADDELPIDPGPRYTMLFRPSNDGSRRSVSARSWKSISKVAENYFKDGLRVASMDMVVDDGKLLYAAVFEKGSGAQRWEAARKWSEMNDVILDLRKKNLYLTSLSVVVQNGAALYSGVFRPGKGDEWITALRPWSEMSDTIKKEKDLGMYLTTLDTAVVKGEIQYAAVFRNDKGKQEVARVQSLDDIKKKSEQLLKDGMYLTMISTVKVNGKEEYCAVYRPGSGEEWVVRGEVWKDMSDSIDDNAKKHLQPWTIQAVH